MESVPELLNVLFGGQIDVTKILTILVSIFAVIKTFTEWRAKAKLIKADKELSSYDKKLDAQKAEMDKLKESNSILCDVILTCYLSNSSISEETKKQIAAKGEQLEKIANIDVQSNTKKLIEIVKSVNPNAMTAEKEDNIMLEAAVVEKAIDDANDIAKSAIDKIKLS